MLDFDLFQCIVEEYKLDQCQEQLHYPEHLKAYIQKHKISEFLEINPALEKYSGAEELVLKFDINLSICKLSTLLDLKSTVAEILGLKSSALRLLRVKEGCMVATFLIPECVANSADREFTSKQVQDFQNLSLLWLKCGAHKFLFTLKKGERILM